MSCSAWDETTSPACGRLCRAAAISSFLPWGWGAGAPWPETAAPKRPVVHVLHEKHVLSSCVGRLHGGLGQQLPRRCHGFYQQPVIAKIGRDFAAVIEDVFPHHGPVGDLTQGCQLLQDEIQIFSGGCHKVPPVLFPYHTTPEEEKQPSPQLKTPAGHGKIN